MQKIMIIDDEIDILGMLERYFRLNGYVVITAESAAEAQNKLSQMPDLILLDINMPELDGITFCKNIRDYVSCPILFLTTNTDDRNKIKGFSAGGDDYIVKPFSIDELGARVSAHLRRENRAKNRAQILFDTHFVIDFSQRAMDLPTDIIEEQIASALDLVVMSARLDSCTNLAIQSLLRNHKQRLIINVK